MVCFRMVGADESTELLRHPFFEVFMKGFKQKISVES